MSRRLPAALVLVLTAAALGGPRRVSADETALRHLLDRATQVLREAEAYRAAGRRELARDRARRATSLLAQADRLGPDDAAVAFLSVQAAVFAEDAPAARRWITQYARRSPYGEKDPNLHYARAMVSLRLDGRADQAVQGLERMAMLSPRGLTRPANVLRYEALTTLAGRLGDAGHVRDAVRRFEEASQVARRLADPSREAAARANAGITLLAYGHPAEAEPLFAGLHGRQPADPVFATYLGRCLRLQERFAEAAAVLEPAAAAGDAGRVAPPHVGLVGEAWLELGIARLGIALREVDGDRRARTLEAARQAFERFTTIAPRSAEGWHRLGRLLAEDLDLPLEAIHPLERAHGLDPACDGALRLLLVIAGRVAAPPAGETPGSWGARRAGWERELEENVDRWRAERERRRKASRAGSDGCP